MRENVTANINHIDAVMKERVESYKDAHNEQDTLGEGGPAGQMSAGQSLASLGAALPHMLERPNDRRKELMDKYSHLLKKGDTNNRGRTTADINDPFAGNSGHGDNYEVIFEEMERLKESESESRSEVLKLENYLRMSRMLQRMKETVNKQQHDYKIDNLKQ